MVFSSTVFLAWFLPVFFSLYLLADTRYKNALILAGSVLFYAWGAPKFLFLVLATTLLDFHLVKWMASVEDPRRRKQLLVLSVSLNVGLLAVFKYANFFVGNLDSVLHSLSGGHIPWVEIALPIGISFFVFESLTYVVDVYRGVHKPLKNFWEYQMYILMFPKLIAGPIVRYHELADQIKSRTHAPDLFLTGFYRFVLGLSKKVLIANVLGAGLVQYQQVDAAELSMAQAWVGLLAGLMQVYFDFSGYSDMALGLGRMLGFHLPENFDNPFLSQSITEYWRRWHISFSNWMRDYLFIPLGGSRGDHAWKVYRNLGIVFLASGLWHGASWNFVLFGAFHGLCLILERAFLLSFLEKLPKLVRMAYMTLVVVVGINFFWTEDLSYIWSFFGSMVGGGMGSAELSLGPDFRWVLGLACFFAWFRLIPRLDTVQDFWFSKEQTIRGHLLLLGVSIFLFVVCLAFVSWTSYNPFLYFRF